MDRGRIMENLFSNDKFFYLEDNLELAMLLRWDY